MDYRILNHQIAESEIFCGTSLAAKCEKRLMGRIPCSQNFVDRLLTYRLAIDGHLPKDSPSYLHKQVR